MNEKRALQIAVAVCGLVPVLAGLAGVIKAGTMAGGPSLDLATDSHFRYLSGLLLGIGLSFWSTIPNIERRTIVFRVLTAIVFVGGLARLYGVAARGFPPAAMTLALGMELVVTPLLCLWQSRISRGREISDSLTGQADRAVR